ncbi:lipid A biosynthesis lauroyl acyltransferase [Ahrensia marina]|uniref:Lipid A biosynthesis lauroyl acyltransferase n=1 Tax=Ahrensia marina TaxID=1514904 RepID=A0A0N0E8U8_9HYPH|nr:lipid A biosynthesis lauroyl acyltransferase [Ahrensia marina]KPB02771.1 lipid A biosynthesis lauroyl acyltransferase [Ahrensia marina]
MSWKVRIFKAKTKLKRVRYWFEAKISFAVLATLRLLPMKSAMTVNAKMFQFLGPFLPRHKMVVKNLSLAFPEKSKSEIDRLARGMWRNMGRLVSEYIFLDKLFDYDPESDQPGLVEVEGEDIFRRLNSEGKPCIFFTGHVGNFELLPICAATYGLDVTALFRPPNNPYIADRLLASRTTEMGHLVPSKAGAAWGLARALDNGGSVGVLVDQKFGRGIVSEFFGRPVRTNPLLPKLARQFNVPVYPARCIRLPGGRFRLILEDELVLPRDENNEIDIARSAQLLNDVVERWVRETPEQWMWLHRRWIDNE